MTRYRQKKIGLAFPVTSNPGLMPDKCGRQADNEDIVVTPPGDIVPAPKSKGIAKRPTPPELNLFKSQKTA
jgi:hypothetical protein